MLSNALGSRGRLGGRRLGGADVDPGAIIPGPGCDMIGPPGGIAGESAGP